MTSPGRRKARRAGRLSYTTRTPVRSREKRSSGCATLSNNRLSWTCATAIGSVASRPVGSARRHSRGGLPVRGTGRGERSGAGSVRGKNCLAYVLYCTLYAATPLALSRRSCAVTHSPRRAARRPRGRELRATCELRSTCVVVSTNAN